MTSNAMKLGVQLPEVERPVSWVEMRDIARTAEDVGFDSIWVGDHLLYRDETGTTGPMEAWSVLAGLAEATNRVTLGPLVAATAFHSPAMLAKKAATVDEISGGRLVLGIGAGWNRTEFEAFGYPFDRRASRFEEAFTIIRTLLREGSIDFEGEYYTLRECELVPPARPEGPPIMVGSQGPRVLSIALPHVEAWNGWYAWYGNTPEGARSLLEKVDAVCADVGRDAEEVHTSVTVFVEAPDSETATARSARWDEPDPLSGTPEDIASGLLEFAAVGVDEVQLVVNPITAASVEWLAAVVELCKVGDGPVG